MSALLVFVMALSGMWCVLFGLAAAAWLTSTPESLYEEMEREQGLSGSTVALVPGVAVFASAAIALWWAS